MKLIQYTRVSGKTQVRDGYGLKIQVKDCREWAEIHGHRIVKVYSDKGISGTLGSDVVDGQRLADRPGLQEAIAAVQDGTADGIICGKADRIGRATHVQEAVYAMIWRAGGHVFAADTGEILADDPNDPMRTAVRKIIGVLAELDRAMAVKRMKDGREAKAATGKHSVGVYPFGYRAGGEGRDRDAVVNPDELPAVELIGKLRGEGASYRQIVTALNDAGIKARHGTWYPSAVRNIAMRLESAE